MKIRHADNPIPRIWKNHPHARGIVFEKDLSIGSSRLKAKLLIFEDRKAMSIFWKNALGVMDLGDCCSGVVNQLRFHVISFADGMESQITEVDPRYFCVIGLVQDRLTYEIITHEAVHAAYAYVKRIKKSPWDQDAKDFDEEEIAYPVGRIADSLFVAITEFQT